MGICAGSRIRRFSIVWAGALVAIPSLLMAENSLHVELTVSNATEAVKWYARHLDCEPIGRRPDAVDCGRVEIGFTTGITVGGSPGTGVDHIGFSVVDLEEKMAELEAVGVQGSGVRLQRFDDGATFHDVPGLFKLGFIFDPWGTRIELVEDPDTLGFHHVHLSSADPKAALAWYHAVFGGTEAKLRGRIDGLRFGETWLLISRHAEGTPAATDGRSIDHLGFVAADLGKAVKGMSDNGARVVQQPVKPEGGRSAAKRAFIAGPDNVRIAVVEPGWAGVERERRFAARDTSPASTESYEPPRTPWGEPDLQAVWTNNAAHGIPLERPRDATSQDALTAEEAEARRERGTLGSIWGYEREWRDTTLGYVKSAPSTQVAMVIDPADGRLPPMTEKGKEMAAAAQDEREDYASQPPGGPEDLSPYVRCISRGLPGMMMPGIYNNGLQIVQSPGFVAVQKEMIHETRVIPTAERPALSAKLEQWLGDPHGRWEGDTLVVETTNFNGRLPYRGSGENLKLVERYRLLGPDLLEYLFTVEDPTIWTRPWTGRFTFEKDDSQYELVEYACHEGNYGMSNILSGARARDKQAAREPAGDGR